MNVGVFLLDCTFRLQKYEPNLAQDSPSLGFEN